MLQYEHSIPISLWYSNFPSDEQVRRRDVMRQHYFVRMMIDGREVVQSKSK